MSFENDHVFLQNEELSTSSDSMKPQGNLVSVYTVCMYCQWWLCSPCVFTLEHLSKSAAKNRKKREAQKRTKQQMDGGGGGSGGGKPTSAEQREALATASYLLKGEDTLSNPISSREEGEGEKGGGRGGHGVGKEEKEKKLRNLRKVWWLCFVS